MRPSRPRAEAPGAVGGATAEPNPPPPPPPPFSRRYVNGVSGGAQRALVNAEAYVEDARVFLRTTRDVPRDAEIVIEHGDGISGARDLGRSPGRLLEPHLRDLGRRSHTVRPVAAK